MRRWSAISMALLVLAGSAALHVRAAEAPRNYYSIGIVPQFSQRTLYAAWAPILHQLEQRTGLRFKIEGSPGVTDFEREFMSGKFDFAYMNPYHTVKAHQAHGYVPLVRDGGKSLNGIVVVAADSTITDVRQLEGATTAFPSANALGATLMVRADLIDKFGVMVRPLYVQTHSSVYLHVARGLVVAGGGVMSSLLLEPPAVQKKLRVLYETRHVVSHPFVANPRVAAADREKVRQAWLQMGRDATMRPLLEKIAMQQVVAASIDDYRPLTAMGLERFYEE